MVIAIDPTATEEIVLSADKDSDRPTKFRIGLFDQNLRAYILDQGRPDRAGESGNMLAVLTLAVKFGLRGWENFLDKHGAEVPFSTVSVPVPGVGNREGLSDRTLDLLGPYVFEIGAKIVNLNVVNPADSKNFGGPSL